MNYTLSGSPKGEWKAYLTDKKPDKWMVCAGEIGEIGIAKLLDDNQEANAHLIAAVPLGYELADAVLDDKPLTEIRALARKFMAKVVGK